MKRYSTCQVCGRPIEGVPTQAPFITLARATAWRHVGFLRKRFSSHVPVVPEADR